MALLSSHQTADRLGVKVETVYAYASRGLLRRHPGPDGRSSWFDSRDVEAMAHRGRPRRSTRDTSLDLLIETRLTSIAATGVRYRGRSSADLAANCTFEQVAELLWLGVLPDRHRSWPGETIPLPPATPRPTAIRLVAAALVPCATDQTVGDGEAVAVVGRRLLATIVDSLPRAGDAIPRLRLAPGEPALTATIAGRLWRSLSSRRPAPGVLPMINTALVTLADHELAASTLAVRVAASTRAHPVAAVLAGLGTLQGYLHGGATRASRILLDDAIEFGAHQAMARALERHPRIPGFGHRVYPDIDPRAALLLDRVRAVEGSHRMMRVVDELTDAIRRRHGRAPNVDFGLAAVTRVAGLEPDAGEVLMALARIAGWLAHVLEEYGEAPLRFRPRASYVGP